MGDLVQLPVRHNPLLSKKQLARHFRCSERTIERMVSQGLPSEMIEGARYFRLQAATEWRKRCRTAVSAAN